MQSWSLPPPSRHRPPAIPAHVSGASNKVIGTAIAAAWVQAIWITRAHSTSSWGSLDEGQTGIHGSLGNLAEWQPSGANQPLQ